MIEISYLIAKNLTHNPLFVNDLLVLPLFRRAIIKKLLKAVQVTIDELLIKCPIYREKFSDVWLWNEFLFRDELGIVDWALILFANMLTANFKLSNVNSTSRRR